MNIVSINDYNKTNMASPGEEIATTPIDDMNNDTVYIIFKNKRIKAGSFDRIYGKNIINKFNNFEEARTYCSTNLNCFAISRDINTDKSMTYSHGDNTYKILEDMNEETDNAKAILSHSPNTTLYFKQLLMHLSNALRG